MFREKILLKWGVSAFDYEISWLGKGNILKILNKENKCKLLKTRKINPTQLSRTTFKLHSRQNQIYAEICLIRSGSYKAESFHLPWDLVPFGIHVRCRWVEFKCDRFSVLNGNLLSSSSGNSSKKSVTKSSLYFWSWYC